MITLNLFPQLTMGKGNGKLETKHYGRTKTIRSGKRMVIMRMDRIFRTLVYIKTIDKAKVYRLVSDNKNIRK